MIFVRVTYFAQNTRMATQTQTIRRPTVQPERVHDYLYGNADSCWFCTHAQRYDWLTCQFAILAQQRDVLGAIFIIITRMSMHVHTVFSYKMKIENLVSWCQHKRQNRTNTFEKATTTKSTTLQLFAWKNSYISSGWYGKKGKFSHIKHRW